MSDPGYPIEELLPHAGAMVLLDEVVAVSEDAITTALVVRCDGMFDEPGSGTVPASIGLEYLAQTIAAWAGYHALLAGRAVRPGLLVGTRHFRTSAARLRCGLALRASAERVMQDEDGISAFDCRVTGTGVEQSAVVKVFLPRNVEQYLLESEA